MDKIKSQSLHWFFSFNHPFFLKNQTQRISNSSKFLTFFKIIISLSPLCILIKLAETGITISDRSVYKQADLISSKSSCANSRQKKPSQSEHRSCVSRIEKGMYTMYTKGNKSATMAVIRLAELFSIIDFQRNEQRRIVFDSRFDDSRFPNNKRRIPRLVNCAISMSVGSNEVICETDRLFLRYAGGSLASPGQKGPFLLLPPLHSKTMSPLSNQLNFQFRVFVNENERFEEWI